MLTNLIMICIMASAVIIYFLNNPMEHKKSYRMRCFWNWFPLGLTYAFLYMGRYNLTVSQSALSESHLGPLMPKEAFGAIFGTGALVYGFAFLINGPLTDKIGGKRSMLIGSGGAALMNIIMGIITYLVLNEKIPPDNLINIFTVLYSINMYFQSFGAVSIVKVNAHWFHVKERGVLGGIFGTLISLGLYFAFDWCGSIEKATRIKAENLNLFDQCLYSILGTAHSQINQTWFVFFIPAGILLFFFILDLFIVKDTPGEAGFEDFDTGDASSGEANQDFTTIDLYKKLLTNPIVLTIAFIEFCSGVTRNGIMHWYRIYIKEMLKGSDAVLFESGKFFVDNWGLLLCFAGIFGGFTAGFISDKLFQSRRGPSAVFMYATMLVCAVVMCFILKANQIFLGLVVLLMSLCVIGVHGILSGTATADFGGRKAAATAVGIVDGFVYLGTAVEGFALGYLTSKSWSLWPIFLIPFCIIGLILSIRIWTAFPDSRRKGGH